MSSAPLLGRLRSHLATRGWFKSPGTAVLAVSGGADSLALLDLFATLSGELDLTLHAAHADHGIRADSGQVAESVRSLAEDRYGIPATVGHLGLGAGASETRARQARYEFLRRVQRQSGAEWLITAHHADDQAETVLLRVLRGSAPAGLAGIAERGPDGLLRPLLVFTREDLAAHAVARGLPVHDDPANRDPRHLRSWLREVVVPALRERVPGLRGALLEVAAHAERERAAFDALVDRLPGLGPSVGCGQFGVARPGIGTYDEALSVEILRALARRAGLRLGPRAAARCVRFALRVGSGRRLDLGGGVIAEAAFDRLIVSRPVPVPTQVELSGTSGEVGFGAYVVRWTASPAPSTQERNGWSAWFTPGALVVRPPAAGDRLRPLGGVGHRAVRRLLMEADVPRWERWRYPILARHGAPVWVPGICRAEAELPAAGEAAVRVDVVSG